MHFLEEDKNLQIELSGVLKHSSKKKKKNRNKYKSMEKTWSNLTFGSFQMCGWRERIHSYYIFKVLVTRNKNDLFKILPEGGVT